MLWSMFERLMAKVHHYCPVYLLLWGNYKDVWSYSIESIPLYLYIIIITVFEKGKSLICLHTEDVTSPPAPHFIGTMTVYALSFVLAPLSHVYKHRCRQKWERRGPLKSHSCLTMPEECEAWQRESEDNTYSMTARVTTRGFMPACLPRLSLSSPSLQTNIW